ncbi:unnamed protein product [Staurois parvus]|uniref:Dynactin subunit 5 n=1 Tax=Staurois parvus TaxID=386267 RepID=A0ABN9FWJ0_9NEOB|nr:unnamed protein product [Staurois parvus]
MELSELLYNKSEYIETASGNKVSRQSVLCGSQNIVLNGKTIVMNDCIIRGDLANVRVGRHCVIKSRSVIRPPFKKFSKGVAFFPVTHWGPCLHRRGLCGECSPDRILCTHRQELCHWPKMRLKGLLQDFG